MVLQFGIVTEVFPEKGTARVSFEEHGIVSDELPILQARTLSDKVSETLDIKEHVACLMDANNENGVILGAIYSKSEAPPSGSGKDVWMREFKDGTKISYDRASSQLQITVGSSAFTMEGNKIKFNTGANFGLVNVVELVTRLNILEAAFNALATAYNAHFHVPGGPVPITPFTTVLTTTTQVMIEDTKVTH